MVHQQMHILYLMQNVLCEFKVNKKLNHTHHSIITLYWQVYCSEYNLDLIQNYP